MTAVMTYRAGSSRSLQAAGLVDRVPGVATFRPPVPARDAVTSTVDISVPLVDQPSDHRALVGRPGGAFYVGTSRRALDALRRINDRTRRALAYEAALVGSRPQGE